MILGKVVSLVLFYDIHEVRIGDTDPYQKRYLQINEIRAAEEQVAYLSILGKKY